MSVSHLLILTQQTNKPTGVPANWRALEGHSVNTYTMINGEGKEQWVKLFWNPKGGALSGACVCQALR